MDHSSNTAYALYIASALGAIALYMAMPRRRVVLSKMGALLGGMTLGGLWLVLAEIMPGKFAIADGATPYYYVFSILAIASAVRVITHTRPVLAALWFVMVVLATSGLLLTLSAGFVAFAMVIIYAGAILVTYLFVIMLAGQAGDPTGHDELPDYEVVSHEPAVAVMAGFFLLALLLSVAFGPIQANPDAAAMTDREMIATHLQYRAADRMLQQLNPDTLATEVAAKEQLSNIERVGMNLFEQNPLGLELAGIILLVALVGAVIISRTRISDEDKPLIETKPETEQSV